MAFWVVPAEMKATKLGAGPIHGQFIIEAEGGKEMIGIISFIILDAEIINT